MITKTDLFSSIINNNKSISSVLDLFGVGEVDYNRTIEEVGLALSINPDFMVAIIKAFDQDSKPDKKLLMSFPLETILDYLKKTHRYYLDKKIPEIELSLLDIIRQNNQEDSVLVALGNLFIAYKKKLIDHIKSEEDELFPYIEFLITQFRGDFNYTVAQKIISKFTIQHFEESHSNVEEAIERTRETIVRYSPQKSFVMSYRIFLNQLDLFEKELHRHSIIEDEVLVPKALQIEDFVKTMVFKVRSTEDTRK